MAAVRGSPWPASQCSAILLVIGCSWIVGATEAGCNFVEARYTTPTDGVFLGSNGPVNVSQYSSMPESGIFCPSCESYAENCSSIMCHWVPELYSAPSDGIYYATDMPDVIHQVTAGSSSPVEGIFCPTCKRLAKGERPDVSGYFVSDDGLMEDMKAETASKQAGSFCQRTEGNSEDVSGNENYDYLSDLILSPSWNSFANIDEVGGMLSGTMLMEMQWYWNDFTGQDEYAAGAIAGSVPTIVNVINFAGGTSGRVSSAEFHYSIIQSPDSVKQYRKASILYVGAFHQTFDGTCYPWDTQTMKFTITLPPPFNKLIKLIVQCASEDQNCHQDRAGGGAPARITNTAFMGEVRKSFTWSAFVCEQISTSKVVCSMEGERSLSKTFLLQIAPGIIMSIIGFASFVIPPAMVMPRVATTMLALMTFVSKGSSVMAAMPTTGLNIVEEFYLLGIVVMLLNVLGHIACFRMPSLANFISQISLGFTLLLFLLILAVNLQSKTCTAVDESAKTAVTAALSIMLLASGVFSAYRNKTSLQHWLASRKDNIVDTRSSSEQKVEATQIAQDIAGTEPSAELRQRQMQAKTVSHEDKEADTPSV